MIPKINGWRPASRSTKQNCLGTHDDFKKRCIGSVQKQIEAGPIEEEQAKGKAEKTTNPKILQNRLAFSSSFVWVWGIFSSSRQGIVPVSLKWGKESFLDDGLEIQSPLSDKESPSLDGLG